MPAEIHSNLVLNQQHISNVYAKLITESHNQTTEQSRVFRRKVCRVGKSGIYSGPINVRPDMKTVTECGPLRLKSLCLAFPCHGNLAEELVQTHLRSSLIGRYFCPSVKIVQQNSNNSHLLSSYSLPGFDLRALF